MALTPFSRDRFFPSDDPAVLEAVEHIAERLGLEKRFQDLNPDEQQLGERNALKEMAATVDSKTTEEGIGRMIEGLFRRGFTHPDKLKTKPKDIIAALVGQEIARRSFHGTPDFTSPEGKKNLEEIEHTVLALLPKSEPEGRAVIDCMKRFDAAIIEALTNDDKARAPELWQAVQDYYTHVDRALFPSLQDEPAKEADERKAHIEQSGIPSLYSGPWTSPAAEFKQTLQRQREHNRTQQKRSKLKDFYQPKLAISPGRREATLTLLRGQLMGHVRELFDRGDPDVEEKQRKFVEMFEHLKLLEAVRKVNFSLS